MLQRLKQRFFEWITFEKPLQHYPLCDFDKIRYEVRPGDVILVEGRSRVSEVIRQITQSPWTHAGLYIGRIHEIDDVALRAKLLEYYQGNADVQLVIEGYLGKGTIASPLENYHKEHLRICRPQGLARQDAQQVVAFAIQQLGRPYDVRQIFDLARFLIPWSFMPRRWRSSLFEFRSGESTRTVCSTMIAEAFASINFPILPLVQPHEQTGIELFARNPRLITPRDFDYSPHFEIIKHPFIAFAEGPYRNLPWNRQGLISQDGKTVRDPHEQDNAKGRFRAKPNFASQVIIKKPATLSSHAVEVAATLNEPLQERLLPPEPLSTSKKSFNSSRLLATIFLKKRI